MYILLKYTKTLIHWKLKSRCRDYTSFCHNSCKLLPGWKLTQTSSFSYCFRLFPQLLSSAATCRNELPSVKEPSEPQVQYFLWFSLLAFYPFSLPDKKMKSYQVCSFHLLTIWKSQFSFHYLIYTIPCTHATDILECYKVKSSSHFPCLYPDSEC